MEREKKRHLRTVGDEQIGDRVRELRRKEIHHRAGGAQGVALVEEDAAVATSEEEEVVLLADGEASDALFLHLVEELDCTETLWVAVLVHVGHVPHFERRMEWRILGFGLHSARKEEILQYPGVAIVLPELLAELVGDALRFRYHEIGTAVSAVANGVQKARSLTLRHHITTKEDT